MVDDSFLPTANYAKWKEHGRKLYFPIVRGSIRLRTPLKTASQALAHAQRLERRYWRLKVAR
jgi:hypothetical protein